MTTELIRAIIASHGDGDTILAEHIARELAEIEAIRGDLRKLAGEKVAVRNQQERLIDAIESREASVRARCKHWTRTHHGDPSGGSDSSTVCDQCGKDL